MRCLPFLYKGSMDTFNNLILNIKEQHPIYNQYTEEYFITNKVEYYKNQSYNYYLLPKDCRSNSSIERYNKYIKENLGKKKFVMVEFY